MEQQLTLFDYNTLDTDTRAFVHEKAQAIHARLKRTAEDIIAIGQDLMEVKARLAHGKFLPWLQSEFGMTDRHARNFMYVASRFGTKLEIISNLPVTVIYELAAPSTPDIIIEKIEAGTILPSLPAIREAKREIQEGQQQNLTPEQFVSEVFPGLQWRKDNRTLGLDEFADPLPTVEEETDKETPNNEYTPITSIHPLERLSYQPFIQSLTPIIPESWKLPPEMRGNISEMPVKSPTLTALQSSESNEWYTPAIYVETVRELMGGIDLDPASCELANQVIQATTYYDVNTNGLDKPWYGRVWLNPPYGRDTAGSNQEIWSHYLLEQYVSGITKEAVLLVNANTEARWFQPFYNYLICFTNHRIKFYNAEGTPNQPTQGNALVYFGTQSERFYELFNRFGVVVQRFAA